VTAATSEASPQAADAALAEAAAAAQLTTADISPDFSQRQDAVRRVDRRDAPGLTSGASGRFVTLVSPDEQEFVNQLTVIPDDPGGVAAMLEAFNPANYLGGLTAGDPGATAEPLTLDGAPEGARALSYRGIDDTGLTPQQVEGEVVAFGEGRVFVVIVHGRFAPSTYQIDLGPLASIVEGRLQEIEELR
jgi:hypothetical protein